jgi:hypothetical protein
MSKTIRVLCVGDVVGSPGRQIFQKNITRIKSDHKVDFVVVNGENSSGDGRGITSRIVGFFKHNHADIITTGNHVFSKKEIYSYFESHDDLLRPANFSSAAPGKGVALLDCNGVRVAVINMQGRVFMREHIDCPFKTMDSLLSFVKHKADVIIVDFHAEATAEKAGFAYYLDGKVSAVVGTHTHVQTADERILPNGTAFITDLGMCGAVHSMIGMQKEPVIERFITQMPTRFNVEIRPPIMLNGVIIAIDADSGKAQSIERIKVVDNDLVSDDKE